MKHVLEASKRLLGKPVQGKQSVDVDLVTKVAEKFNTPQASISNLRTCFIFIIAFAGLMRCDEVTRINKSHISIFSVLSVKMINVLKGISFILQGQARLHVLFPSLKKCYLNCLIILFSIWFVDFHPKALPFNILSLILELGKFSARL